MISYEFKDRITNVIEHRWRETGENPHPESTTHDYVGICQISDYPKINILVGRLAHDVAREHQSGANEPAV